MSAYHTDDQRWAAVAHRDLQALGHFVYAVRTTGLYCPPGSPARLPRRENVAFFDTPDAAEAAGYQPSRHMAAEQLRQQRAALITEACRTLERSETAPSLEALARQSGMSPYHFHRLFKAQTGLTPKAFANASRARRLRQALQDGQSTVTEAIYDAGFNTSSRFYECADALLGMPAADYRQGGRGNRIRFAIGACSLGAILVAQSERGICTILLDDDPEHLVRQIQDLFPNAELIGADGAFEAVVAQVVGFIEAPALGLDLPLDVRGTAFQQRVWQALQQIPAGTTASYSDIATLMGAPRAVRAVAQACAANRLAVAIPCHRVIRRDGDLSGYRWGVERKRELLARESLP